MMKNQIGIHTQMGIPGDRGIVEHGGTWTLNVFVTDLQVERNLRVRGDMHVGGVMIRLVDELGRRPLQKPKTLNSLVQKGSAIRLGIVYSTIPYFGVQTWRSF